MDDLSKFLTDNPANYYVDVCNKLREVEFEWPHEKILSIFRSCETEHEGVMLSAFFPVRRLPDCQIFPAL